MTDMDNKKSYDEFVAAVEAGLLKETVLLDWLKRLIAEKNMYILRDRENYFSMSKPTQSNPIYARGGKHVRSAPTERGNYRLENETGSAKPYWEYLSRTSED